jgi:hypothetical protein
VAWTHGRKSTVHWIRTKADRRSELPKEEEKEEKKCRHGGDRISKEDLMTTSVADIRASRVFDDDGKDSAGAE